MDSYKYKYIRKDINCIVKSFREQNDEDDDLLEFYYKMYIKDFKIPNINKMYIRKLHVNNKCIIYNCENVECIQNCNITYGFKYYVDLLQYRTHIYLGDYFTEFKFENPNNEPVYLIANGLNTVVTETNTFSLFNEMYFPNLCCPYTKFDFKGITNFNVKCFYSNNLDIRNLILFLLNCIDYNFNELSSYNNKDKDKLYIDLGKNFLYIDAGFLRLRYENSPVIHDNDRIENVMLTKPCKFY